MIKLNIEKVHLGLLKNVYAQKQQRELLLMILQNIGG